MGIKAKDEVRRLRNQLDEIAYAVGEARELPPQDCRGPEPVRLLIRDLCFETERLKTLLAGASQREGAANLECSRLRMEAKPGPADPGSLAAVSKAIHRLDKVSTMVLHWPDTEGSCPPPVKELLRLLKEALAP